MDVKSLLKGIEGLKAKGDLSFEVKGIAHD